jgi:hypothetical protein
VVEDPALDIVDPVAHAHERVVELLEPIAIEVIEAICLVIRLRTREDLEHHVLALVRLEELGNHCRIKGALGQQAVTPQVKQVRAAGADGVGDIREQLTVRQHHAGAAASGNGHDLTGTCRGTNGLDCRGEHVLLVIKKRTVHVKSYEVKGHAIPSVKSPQSSCDRRRMYTGMGSHQPISTAAVHTQALRHLKMLETTNNMQCESKPRRRQNSKGSREDFCLRWDTCGWRWTSLAMCRRRPNGHFTMAVAFSRRRARPARSLLRMLRGQGHRAK